MPRAEQLMELGRMREKVELLREEMERGWRIILAAQRREGFPDFDRVQDEWIKIRQAMRKLDGFTYEEFLRLRP